jgi:NADH dehydrogenase/NADH:ubiquinone oxidoreductase subunit G
MVEVEGKGTPRRMVPACTTPAGEGMVVRTMTSAGIQARKDMLELLLINHPLDCPVCDKAGECRLQDLTHEYGLGPGAFAEKKRTTPPAYDSPLIEQNQNRCIHCGKCVRRAPNAAVWSLTFAMRGGRSKVSAAFGNPLACEFCGECVEICSVGALITKQFKHKARTWNLEQEAPPASTAAAAARSRWRRAGGRWSGALGQQPLPLRQRPVRLGRRTRRSETGRS